MSTCSRCGAALGAADTYFDLSGAICCKKCEQIADIGQLTQTDDKAMDAMSRAHDRGSLALRVVGGVVLAAILAGVALFVGQRATKVGECGPCQLDTDCTTGLTCMQFGAKLESKAKMCAKPESIECKKP